MPMAGGILQHGYQCGMIWGAVLAAGAQAMQRCGPGPETEIQTIETARELVALYRDQNGETDCYRLTGIDHTSSALKMMVYFLVQGGTIGCLRKAFRYTPEAFDKIRTASSENKIEVPAPPISCAALLAKKKGASDLHQTMSAGLAGGIGLSGGACGALGTAIWLTMLDKTKAGSLKLEYKDPEVLKLIDRFVRQTTNEFVCARIIGRRFDNPAAHAAYLRNGGCAALIETLASA